MDSVGRGIEKALAIVTVDKGMNRPARRRRMAEARARRDGGSSYPLVTIGGGAFGDLPAQAAKLSRANVAVAATRIFFIGSPYPQASRP
jgi:hypothetical protein